MQVTVFNLLERKDFSEGWEWTVCFVTFSRARAKEWASHQSWRTYSEVPLMPEDIAERQSLETNLNGLSILVQQTGDGSWIAQYKESQ